MRESGFEQFGGPFPTDFYVCGYEGNSGYVYVVSEAMDIAFARGQGVIMDNTYKSVKTAYSVNGRAVNYEHGFNVLPGRSLLITVYQSLQYDVSGYGIITGQGVSFQYNVLIGGSVDHGWYYSAD